MIKQARCLSEALLATFLELKWKKRSLFRCASSLTVGLSEGIGRGSAPLINLRRASLPANAGVVAAPGCVSAASGRVPCPWIPAGRRSRVSKLHNPNLPPRATLTLVRQLHGFRLIDLFDFPPHTAAFVLLRFNFDFDPRFCILLAFYIHSSITGTRQSSQFPLPFFPS